MVVGRILLKLCNENSLKTFSSSSSTISVLDFVLTAICKDLLSD